MNGGQQGIDQRLGRLLDAVHAAAAKLDHAHLGVEHLFLAMLDDDGVARQLVSGLGLDPVTVRDAIRREVGRGKVTAPAPTPTPRLSAVLDRAASGPVAGGEDGLLRAILAEGESLPVRYLCSFGYEPAALIAQMSDAPGDGDADGTRLAATVSAAPIAAAAPAVAKAGPPIKPKETVPVSLPTPTLDRFGRDLCKLGRMGKLADALGREREIEQMITILARTQKSNPLLLGEAGVGKTAIVEGLARRIVEERVPATLRGKRIVEVAMGSLTAGTSLRGQFEERIDQIVKEATAAPEVILFIDEIHTVMGAGDSQGGAGDAAQMLKPALARGDFSCIGATTQDEFSRFISKDPALERRFTPVLIGELSPEACLGVLQAVAKRIIARHAEAGQHLEILPEALRAAVTLTDRYVKARHQPDKSIDAIDLACADAVVRGKKRVAGDDVAAVVSQWTGIPAERLTREDEERYARMEEVLRSRVVGQDEAVRAISRRVQAALLGLKAANRPVGVFLFMGPSGVGKTKLAKELAAFLFDTPDALIRFDMNEYQERQTVSNLIGSARGYIGSESGGQFTEALRRRPYSVVLLDEIEKAHADVFNVFLAVFDEGRISDNHGHVIDCSNAVFIMTSNIGAADVDFRTVTAEQLRRTAERFLRPELVNRINDVVGFRPLTLDNLAAILDQILAEKVAAFATAQNIALGVDDGVKVLILDEAYDPRMGARPLERAVEDRVVDPLVEARITGRLQGGDRVRAVVDGMKIVLRREEE